MPERRIHIGIIYLYSNSNKSVTYFHWKILALGGIWTRDLPVPSQCATNWAILAWMHLLQLDVFTMKQKRFFIKNKKILYIKPAIVAQWSKSSTMFMCIWSEYAFQHLFCKKAEKTRKSKKFDKKFRKNCFLCWHQKAGWEFYSQKKNKFLDTKRCK